MPGFVCWFWGLNSSLRCFKVSTLPIEISPQPPRVTIYLIPALMYYAKVPIRIHSWSFILYRSDMCIITCTCNYSTVKKSFPSPNPVFHLVISPLCLIPGKHWSFYFIHSFTFSSMSYFWNNVVSGPCELMTFTENFYVDFSRSFHSSIGQSFRIWNGSLLSVYTTIDPFPY